LSTSRYSLDLTSVDIGVDCVSIETEASRAASANGCGAGGVGALEGAAGRPGFAVSRALPRPGRASGGGGTWRNLDVGDTKAYLQAALPLARNARARGSGACAVGAARVPGTPGCLSTPWPAGRPTRMSMLRVLDCTVPQSPLRSLERWVPGGLSRCRWRGLQVTL
jgi:hypothetical protein